MSKRSIVIFLITMLAVGGVASWGIPAGAMQEPVIEERPPLGIPPGYRYDPRGRRDPFVNPIPPRVQDSGPVAPISRPPGLRGVLLNEAQLSGVVVSGERRMNVVVILAPGNRTFFAAPGDELFDAVVKEIRSNAVVFEMKPLEGQDGRISRTEIVRPL